MELGVDHFRKIKPQLEVQDADSVEAPQRPTALDAAPEVIEPTEIQGPNELISAPAQQLPHALRKIDFSTCTTRERLMAQLNANLPLNEYNLPRYIYRVDLLDHLLLLQQAHQGAYVALQDSLMNAIVHLDYSQGFPAFEDGKAFWQKTNYESDEAFSAFAMYLEQTGARTLNGIPQASELLLVWFHIYNWSHRATAYDVFRAAHHQRMRTQRIMMTEDRHYLEAEKIFSRVTKALGNKTDEELLGVEPDKLVSMLEKLSKMQRVAVGLPANGGIPDEKAPTTTSVEVISRTIAKKSGDGAEHVDDFDSDMLLADPETLAMAQELIVKVNGK